MRGNGQHLAAQMRIVQRGDQNMAGSDLDFAEKQGGISPCVVQRVGQAVGNAGRFGHVFGQFAHGLIQRFQHRAPINAQFAQGNGDVAILVGQGVEQPMHQFDVAVALAARKSHGIQKGFISGAVHFPREFFDADFGH